MKKIYTLLILISIFVSSFGQIPAGYYDSAQGKTGSDLRAALRSIITKGQKTNNYNDLYSYYKKTDNAGDNKVWDMYSMDANKQAAYYFHFDSNEECGNYTEEGDCYNREHSVPQSWFNKALPMKADLFIVYPTDGKVNGLRSSYPYGETDGTAKMTSNGSKIDACSFSGYTGIVFEPIDCYKGDFARTYFYVVTRYDVSSWGGASFSGAGLSSWSKALFLKWNSEDPVSQKEIDRNDSIYKIQGNRNPYIDHPEWVNCVFNNQCNSVINPSNFEANAVSTSEIDLSWTANTDNDSVLLAYNTTETFGTPSGDYSAGNTISGGGTVLFIGRGSTTYSHTGLSMQKYFYRIWSIHNGKYSYGEERSATPILPEPTNYPTNFAASSATSTTITLTWSDATGSIEPSAYLIKANLSGQSISAPVDGSPEIDGTLIKNIDFGVQTVTFSGLNSQTSYDFVIYPYNNTGSKIDYKNNATAPALTASTTEQAAYCGNETFDNLSTGNSSYATVNWTGEDGSSWTATDARTDKNLGEGPAICVRQGYIQSGTINNGIEELTVSTERVFSGGTGEFKVFVNGNKIGTIPYSDVVQTSTIQNIDISGAIVLKLDKTDNSSDRVVVDNIKWKCYSSNSNIKNISRRYLNIYPNPSTGSFYLSFDNSFAKNNDIYIYNLAGKIIYSKISNNEKKILVNLKDASNGLYILKIKTEKNIFYKKVIINK